MGDDQLKYFRVASFVRARAQCQFVELRHPHVGNRCDVAGTMACAADRRYAAPGVGEPSATGLGAPVSREFQLAREARSRRSYDQTSRTCTGTILCTDLLRDNQ